MQKALFYLLCLAGLILGLVPAAHTAPVQGGWDKVKMPHLGLTYRMARDYHALPPSPLEEFVKLIYEEDFEAKLKAKDRKPWQPRLEIVILDHSLGVKTAESGVSSTPKKKDKDGKDEEAKKPPPPINTLERYMEQRRRSWLLGVKVENKERGDYTFDEYELIQTKGSGRGVAFVFSNAVRTVAFMGYCDGKSLKEETKIWNGIVSKLKLVEPDSAKLEKESAKQLEAYRKKGYLDPEFRVAARAALPKGWKYRDTENYILVFSTKDEPLVRLVASELEGIRKEYERRFPPLNPVTVVSRVRICKDKQEYMSYGGPAGSGGYWNWREQELVFYDYQDQKKAKKGSGKANSRIVLYHEAFHQYIFYSAGSFSPHSWFNEGTGDYFSGSKVSGGKVKKIGVNTWRIRNIQDLLKQGRTAPWADIIRWSQSQYYGQNKLGLQGGYCYAQGWSMIYFLRESKAAKKHPVWSQILDKYFDTLRDTYNEGLQELEDKGLKDDNEAMGKLSSDSLTKAVDVAFEGVNFREIEAAWEEFIMGLKAPK